MSFSTILVRGDRVGTRFGKDRKDPSQPGRVGGEGGRSPSFPGQLLSVLKASVGP